MADADRFFGREKLTTELVTYLKDHRFLALVGASGSGKSSVVRAGVVTALKDGAIQGSDRWATFTVTPTARPLETLALALLLPGEAEDGNARFKAALHDSPDSPAPARPAAAERGRKVPSVAGHRPVRGAVHALQGQGGAQGVRR